MPAICIATPTNPWSVNSLLSLLLRCRLTFIHDIVKCTMPCCLLSHVHCCFPGPGGRNFPSYFVQLTSVPYIHGMGRQWCCLVMGWEWGGHKKSVLFRSIEVVFMGLTLWTTFCDVTTTQSTKQPSVLPVTRLPPSFLQCGLILLSSPRGKLIFDSIPWVNSKPSYTMS